jgi:uncharacterized membrane protein (DUF485 family)
MFPTILLKADKIVSVALTVPAEAEKPVRAFPVTVDAAILVEFPVLVTSPERFAFVVTVAAFPVMPIGQVPVAFEPPVWAAPIAAGVMVTFDAPVTLPLASRVIAGTCEELPKFPTLELTVARVAVVLPLGIETSPLIDGVPLLACDAIAP